MLTKKEMLGVLKLLDAVGEIAIDIFWGDSPMISKEEQEAFTKEEYDAIWENAVLLVLADLCKDENNEWVSEITMNLSDHYGAEVWRHLLRKELKEAQREENEEN